MSTFNNIICDPNAPIVCAEALKDYLLDCTTRKASMYWDSGIVRTTPRIQNFADDCHKSIQTRFMMPVDYKAGGIVSCGTNDAPGDEGCAPCHGLSQGTETMFKLFSRHCFSMDDCEAHCLGKDEDDVIDIVVRDVATPFMVLDRVHMLFAQFAGLYSWAEAAAPEIQEEMIIDLGTDKLCASAGIDLNMLRDCGEFDLLYVHRDVFRDMRKNGSLQQKVCCGDGNFEFDALEDGTAIVMVDKELGDQYLKDEDGCYISFAANFGTFEYAEGTVKNPIEYERNAAANCGTGAESVYFRSLFALRPLGTEFDITGLKRDYADVEELTDGARWNVTIPVKDFMVAFVKSNCPAP